ncbi:substrate-binding periplasmic protein [Endozoicomonas atrinae]|uniref:substrate-binding periplasmic protein n=1 Tax=Endozoicomonas atrinae TaxID=1333660 RepID=UPI0008250D0B|nr:transporter substrate-binding domain-containing protein [Endozoicomonas atrinae]
MDRDIRSFCTLLLKKTIAVLLCNTLFSVTFVHAHKTNEEIIRVGLLPEDYPPLFWVNENKGIVKDILNAVSENSRFEFEYFYYPFNRLISKVISNELDVETWTSAAWRKKYKQHTYFTKPIAKHCEVTVFRKGESFNTPSPGSMTGKRLGVVQNYTFPSFEPLFADRSIYRADAKNERGVLKMLAYMRTDLALMDRTIASYLLRHHFQNQFETGSVFDCVPITFMFHKNKEQQGKEIDKVLQKLKRDGVIEKIINMYQ